MLLSCKQEKNYESELDETAVIVHSETQNDSETQTILDVPPQHMGAIQEKDGRKIILASDFVKGTFEEDYGKLATVKELFPTIFSYSAKAASDAAPGSVDSIISLKYKASSLQYRKVGNTAPILVNGVLRDETLLLQNGVMTGMTRKEVLEKFGIKGDIVQDTIEVRSIVNNQKLVLLFKADELNKIELYP